MIVKTAFWRRLDLPGRDAAGLIEADGARRLTGQAVFLDARGPAALRYDLDLAPDWSTLRAAIIGFIGEQQVDVRIARSETGWVLDGKPFGMADLADIDLGFTPATNMVQLQRVNLAVGEMVEFDVAWLDAGGDALVRLPQKYRRVSEFDYAYESPMGDYRATIILARSGFAAVYPDLWEMEHPPASAD